MRTLLALVSLASITLAVEPEFPLTEDSKPQPNVSKGTMLKDNYTAKEGSVFPGTQREYQIYLPANFDKTKPAAFMVFQDGVIYQAPVVFDNLIAKKDIPSLVGIFIKPGVVPAANDNALPRFNRSYEYDSVTDTYSQFLIDEFLPALEAKHGLKLSTDPNHAAISGNSSGGICAFMAAWHRPDRFRRVFTDVGTYVGIHGADQLPVLVRKFEPKPLRVFLQSGTGDNNLYCGDWWMANQMMERSLTWAGYDVNHAWGEGGHNAKHASQIFPDVMRWLWRDWKTTMEIKANPKGESKWKGYEIVEAGEWKLITGKGLECVEKIRASVDGTLYAIDQRPDDKSGRKWIVITLSPLGQMSESRPIDGVVHSISAIRGGFEYATTAWSDKSNAHRLRFDRVVEGVSKTELYGEPWVSLDDFVVRSDGCIAACTPSVHIISFKDGRAIQPTLGKPPVVIEPFNLTLSPDQTTIYASHHTADAISAYRWNSDGSITDEQLFGVPETPLAGATNTGGMCVDTGGWLYVASSLGIQVLDQAGRVNFILPTPKPAHDVCFGGKDLSELFIACGDAIYKRPTKAKGVVSGQQAPIKPAAPKL